MIFKLFLVYFTLIITVGIISYIFNVIIFGRKDKRTIEEALGFPIAFGGVILFFGFIGGIAWLIRLIFKM